MQSRAAFQVLFNESIHLILSLIVATNETFTSAPFILCFCAQIVDTSLWWSTGSYVKIGSKLPRPSWTISFFDAHKRSGSKKCCNDYASYDATWSICMYSVCVRLIFAFLPYNSQLLPFNVKLCFVHARSGKLNKSLWYHDWFVVSAREVLYKNGWQQWHWNFYNEHKKIWLAL